MLIEHLDDMRSTSATFFSDKHKGIVQVPLGYVCLDLLTNITKATPRIFVEPCADDGLGACVNERFYFWPDSFIRRGGKYFARPEIRRVKTKWERAYRRGFAKYRYPEWWKPRT
jgi:hypothetical protein